MIGIDKDGNRIAEFLQEAAQEGDWAQTTEDAEMTGKMLQAFVEGPLPNIGFGNSLHEAITTGWAQAAELKVAPKNHGWIKTSERLPEVMQEVQGYGELIGRFFGKYWGGDKHEYEDDEGNLFQGRLVSHWQPLPPLPKGE